MRARRWVTVRYLLRILYFDRARGVHYLLTALRIREAEFFIVEDKPKHGLRTVDAPRCKRPTRHRTEEFRPVGAGHRHHLPSVPHGTGRLQRRIHQEQQQEQQQQEGGQQQQQMIEKEAALTLQTLSRAFLVRTSFLHFCIATSGKVPGFLF